jgi:hypothetical protein
LDAEKFDSPAVHGVKNGPFTALKAFAILTISDSHRENQGQLFESVGFFPQPERIVRNPFVSSKLETDMNRIRGDSRSLANVCRPD